MSSLSAREEGVITPKYRIVSRKIALMDNPDPSMPRCPPEMRRDLCLIRLGYFFLGRIHIGQIVVHERLVPSLKSIFPKLAEARFPIVRMTPISVFGWSDLRSMQANNTSGYNNRYIEGTDRLSTHALGTAIDINPLYNPMIKDRVAYPPGARYDPERPGTLTTDSLVVRLFKDYGYVWGGDWKDPFDPQHFQLP